jgi:hypothetical protein
MKYLAILIQTYFATFKHYFCCFNVCHTDTETVLSHLAASLTVAQSFVVAMLL